MSERGKLYSSAPVEPTGWTTFVEQPRAVAYKPVSDLLERMTVLATWLIVATGIIAWLAGKYYRRQREAAARIEREVIFNDKILANMPSGIALVDPETRRFLQANEAFGQMARRFGNLPPEKEMRDATYEDVNIAPAEAIEKVLSFGTPFQLVEQPLVDRAGMTNFVNVNLLRLQDSKQTVQGVLFLVEDKTRDVRLRQELILGQCGERSISGPALARIAQSAFAGHRHGRRTGSTRIGRSRACGSRSPSSGAMSNWKRA